MKFSKSIIIFLFFSSLSGAYYYALKRTNGNVCQSIMFTMYFLAIKIGLIGPNLPPKLDQDQPTQQLVSRVGYNPYVSILDKYRFIHGFYRAFFIGSSIFLFAGYNKRASSW